MSWRLQFIQLLLLLLTSPPPVLRSVNRRPKRSSFFEDVETASIPRTMPEEQRATLTCSTGRSIQCDIKCHQLSMECITPEEQTAPGAGWLRKQSNIFFQNERFHLFQFYQFSSFIFQHKMSSCLKTSSDFIPTRNTVPFKGCCHLFVHSCHWMY